MVNNHNLYSVYIFANILVGLLLALAASWIAIRLARWVGLMDMPGALPHKQHRDPVPLAGGVALLLALIAGGFVFNFSMMISLWKIFIPALIIFGVGVWDDFKRLPAWIKLIGQIAATVVLIWLGTSTAFLKPGFLGLSENVTHWLNWFVTLFWVVGITNALNLIDSMDGIVVGVSGVALAFLILVTLGGAQEALLRLMTLLLGISIGLNYYNATPAKLFLGDSGAQTFGFLLATICIRFTPEAAYPQGSSWFLPILILGLPIFDTSLVVIARLLKGRPFYEAGRDHTYHRLLDLGFHPTRAVQLMHLMSIGACCIAFVALQLQPLYANLIFVGACLAGLGIIFGLIRKS